MTSRLVPADLIRARKRLLQMHFESGVGHIGGNLSALDAMMLVFHEYLREQDRFILSKGHAAGALYTTLWSKDRLTESDLQAFHRDHTLTPGHPPARGINDIPFATGSLGHGFSLAAGSALAFRLKGIDSRVYCVCSDGEWQEGSTWEALIFSCHQRLANLVVLIDHNELQGFGSTTAVASMAPLWERLKGFDVELRVVDGHDLDQIRAALDRPADRPLIIVLRTTKGHGVTFMENRMEWHYLPMSAEQYHSALLDVESR